MSCANHFDTCRQNIGRPVEIRMTDGRTHRGIIERVSPNRVYLRPFGGRNYGGYGYGWGPGLGWGWSGLGTGLVIGAIAAIIFLPFFW